jgi:glycosyltransferase involved in cell wall biosynthesis
MGRAMQLVVVMPAHNEETQIINCLNATCSVLNNNNWDFKIIVVDDGSTDLTKSLVQNYNNPQVSLISLASKRGKGFAVKSGVLESGNAEVVAFMDSDLDIHPEFLNSYATFINSDIADLVIGSKNHPLSKVQYPLIRKIASRVFYFYVKLILNTKVTDSQVGLKVMKGQLARDIFKNLEIEGFAFDLEVIAEFQHRGARTLEQPIEINHAWDSRVSTFGALIALKEVWMIRRIIKNKSSR